MAKAEIYTTGNCAYCVAAKTLLKQRGYDYEESRVDTNPAKLEEMSGRTNRRSTPQVFIDGEHIGGFEELVEADRAGRLAQPAGDAA
jgi:glutaredoxin 3